MSLKKENSVMREQVRLHSVKEWVVHKEMKAGHVGYILLIRVVKKEWYEMVPWGHVHVKNCEGSEDLFYLQANS